MSYAISLLDKSPLDAGENAAQALARSVQLAQSAEQWGYRRYWLAEHHNSLQLACPSPEVLIAYILARTQRIRVGSGGVMLQHYSPYKVAENFHLLAALAPGRVDLGVGRAPGGLPLATRALQAGQDPTLKPTFAQQVQELAAHLRPAPVAAGQAEGDAQDEQSHDAILRATPLPPEPPAGFVLGGSTESAELAASLGWPLVYAAHINGSQQELERVLTHYRRLSGRPALLAVTAIAAQDTRWAATQAALQQRYRVRVGTGPTVNVGSLALAQAYVRQWGEGEAHIELREAQVLHGTGADVVRALDALHERHGIEEFIIDIPIAQGQARLESARLLAQAHAAAQATTTPAVAAVAAPGTSSDTSSGPSSSNPSALSPTA